MSLILGIGFPRYLGGALKYADLMGLDTIIAKCAQYAALGGAYQATERLQEMARTGSCFHG